MEVAVVCCLNSLLLEATGEHDSSRMVACMRDFERMLCEPDEGVNALLWLGIGSNELQRTRRALKNGIVVSTCGFQYLFPRRTETRRWVLIMTQKDMPLHQHPPAL